MSKTLVTVATRKGAFLFESDDRKKWTMSGPHCEGWPVYHAIYDAASDSIYAAAASEWHGSAIFRSRDRGATWEHSSEGLTYGDDGPKVTTVWNVTAGKDAIYAGVEPAGLFRSDDGGATWSHVSGLRDHPSRQDPGWSPGAGGLICHTIVPHPTDAERMWVAISAVGTFETTDGGATWEARNNGVKADFIPGPIPETGQCVHKLVMAAGEPEMLYQQNHCGVYRSSNGGKSWDEIDTGLPSEFGFVFGAHPREIEDRSRRPRPAGAPSPPPRGS